MSDAPESNPLENYVRPEPSEPAEAHFRNAWQFRKDKNYPAAVAEFEKSLACNPDKPATHFNLALVLDKLDEGARALKHASRAVELFDREGNPSKIHTAATFLSKLKKKYVR